VVDDRKQFWIAHVEAFQAASGSQKHYCERHRLTPRTFRTWRTRIMDGAQRVAPVAYGKAVEVREGTKTDFSPFSGARPDQTLPGEQLQPGDQGRREGGFVVQGLIRTAGVMLRQEHVQPHRSGSCSSQPTDAGDGVGDRPERQPPRLIRLGMRRQAQRYQAGPQQGGEVVGEGQASRS